MPTIEETIRFIAIRYLKCIERSNTFQNGNSSAYMFVKSDAYREMLAYLDNDFACAETPEQKRMIAEKLAGRKS